MQKGINLFLDILTLLNFANLSLRCWIKKGDQAGSMNLMGKNRKRYGIIVLFFLVLFAGCGKEKQDPSQERLIEIKSDVENIKCGGTYEVTESGTFKDIDYEITSKGILVLRSSPENEINLSDCSWNEDFPWENNGSIVGVYAKIPNARNLNYLLKKLKVLEYADVSEVDTSKTVNLSYFFSDCVSLRMIVGAENWDVSKVESLERFFDYCFELEDFEFIKNWDVSSCENFASMFSSCTSVEKLDLSKWDFSSAYDVGNMFFKCKKLKEIRGVENIVTSNTVCIAGMFRICESLQYLNLNNWDTSNVENLIGVFERCTSLKELYIEQWNVSHISDMSSLFIQCPSLEVLDVRYWDVTNVEESTNMIGLYHGLKKFYINETWVENESFEFLPKSAEVVVYLYENEE